MARTETKGTNKGPTEKADQLRAEFGKMKLQAEQLLTQKLAERGMPKVKPVIGKWVAFLKSADSYTVVAQLRFEEAAPGVFGWLRGRVSAVSYEKIMTPEFMDGLSWASNDGPFRGESIDFGRCFDMGKQDEKGIRLIHMQASHDAEPVSDIGLVSGATFIEIIERTTARLKIEFNEAGTVEVEKLSSITPGEGFKLKPTIRPSDDRSVFGKPSPLRRLD